MKKVCLGLGLFVVILVIAVGCSKQPEAAILSEAHALEQAGQHYKAITQYDVLVKVYPQSQRRSEVLFRNGLISFYGLKDFTKAEHYFSRILDEAPRSAYGEGARTLIDFMHSEESADSAEALYHSGIAYTNLLDEFDLGVSLLESITQKYPDARRAAEAQFMKGFVWANTASDTAKARVEYERFLSMYPTHELATSVKWELNYLGRDINEIPEMKGLVNPSDG